MGYTNWNPLGEEVEDGVEPFHTPKSCATCDRARRDGIGVSPDHGANPVVESCQAYKGEEGSIVTACMFGLACGILLGWLVVALFGPFVISRAPADVPVVETPAPVAPTYPAEVSIEYDYEGNMMVSVVL